MISTRRKSFQNNAAQPGNASEERVYQRKMKAPDNNQALGTSGKPAADDLVKSLQMQQPSNKRHIQGNGLDVPGGSYDPPRMAMSGHG